MAVLEFLNPDTGQMEELPLVPNSGIEEAPEDNEQYVRQNGAWAKVEITKPDVDKNYVDTELAKKANNITKVNKTETGAVTLSALPNTFYVYGSLTQLTITLQAEIADVYNEYMIQFTANGKTVIGLPSGTRWATGVDVNSIESGKTYQISIVNNIATLIGG